MPKQGPDERRDWRINARALCFRYVMDACERQGLLIPENDSGWEFLKDMTATVYGRIEEQIRIGQLNRNAREANRIAVDQEANRYAGEVVKDTLRSWGM